MIEKKNIQDILPLSVVQEAILYEYIRNIENETNFEQLAIVLDGPLDMVRVRKSWDNLVAKHAMLRTCFRWKELKKSVQIILKEHSLDFAAINVLSPLMDEKENISQLLLRDRLQKFDLEQVPFRVRVYQLNEFKHLLIISNHHIILDGWSLGILLQEFLQQYACPTTPIKVPLLSYRNFLEKEKQSLPDVEYWKSYLDGYDTHYLHIWHPTIASDKRVLDTQKWSLTYLMDEIKAYGCQHRVSIATIFNACWGLLLQRINGKDEVLFDTVRSVRPNEGFDAVTGLFIRTFPIRFGNIQHADICKQMQDLQAITVEQMDKSNIPSDVISICSNSRLSFSSVIIIENYPLDISAIEKQLPFTIGDLHYREVTKYDMTVIILLFNDKVELSITFDESVIDRNTVEVISNAYQVLLRKVTQEVKRSTDINWSAFLPAVVDLPGFANVEALSVYLGLSDALLRQLEQLYVNFPMATLFRFVPIKMQDKLQLLLLYTSEQNINSGDLRATLQNEIQLLVYDIVATSSMPDMQLLVNVLSQKEVKPLITYTGTIKSLLVIISKILRLSTVHIDASANLFEYGVDSFTIIGIRNAINTTFQVNITIDKIFQAGTIISIAQLIDTATKEKLVTDLSPTGMTLSSQQFNMLMHEEMTGNKQLYLQTVIYDITGPVILKQFQYAFNKLLERHPILRSSYYLSGETADVKLLDASLFNIDGNGSPWFSLSTETLVNGIRLKIKAHHVIADGISLQLLINDLIDLYNGAILPAVIFDYQHYCYWQTEFLLSDGYRLQRENCLRQIPEKKLLLNQFDQVMYIRTSTTSQERVNVKVPISLSNHIKLFCRQQGITRFQFYAGIFAILMSRFLQKKDVFFNLTANGRSDSRFERTVGLMINTILAKMEVDKERTVVSQLKYTSNSLIQSLANQDYPYAMFLQDLKVNGEHEFRDVHNIYLNYLINGVSYINTIEKGDISIYTQPQEEKDSIYKLACYFYENNEDISIQLQYNKVSFAEKDMDYLLKEYLYLIRLCLKDSHATVGALDIFHPRRIEPTYTHPALLNSQYFPDIAIKQSIHRRFEEVVKEKGTVIAVKNVYGHALTYNGLNNAANHLCSYLLRNLQLQPQDRVLSLFEQDELEQFIGIMATLKAGGIYVPLDPELPQIRMQQIIQDASAKLVITTSATGSRLAEWLQQQGLIVVYAVKNEYPEIPNPVLSVNYESPAYILYTSGSTGTPKGVIQAHTNVIHFARAYVNGLAITPADTLLMVAKSNFDAAKMDIYGALLTGASLLVLNVKKHFTEMPAILQQHKITIFHATPTLYREFLMLLESVDLSLLSSIRAVILGGENVIAQDFYRFKKYFSQDAVFVNGLGPTESTITLQHYLHPDDDLHLVNVPVGYPTIDTTVYLLDENKQEAPVWTTGEIVYKSSYLALGYWNNENETNTKFTVDPITGNGRVYLSGDLGKRMPNGTIVYIGRNDTQLKLNGYRIETGEIEAVLESFPEVQRGVVVLHHLPDNSQILTAHCRFIKPMEETEVVHRLKNHLPAYMVPERIISVSSFPLTDTGKIDRGQLSPPVRTPGVNSALKPVTKTEKIIVSIWGEILQLSPDLIGTDHNFFDLGGNSVRLLTLSQRLSLTFQKQIAPNILFSCTTVSMQAKYIDAPHAYEILPAENRISLENKVDNARERIKKKLKRNK